MYKQMLSLVLVATLLSGCAQDEPKQTGGRLIGGVAGAVLGSQFGKGKGQLVGVALGTLAGSYLGGSLGQAMDEKDKALAQQTMNQTLETAPDHQAHGWRNPNTHHSGQFTVTHTEELPNSHMICRDYVHTVTIDGKVEKVHGRACRDARDAKGHWTVQN